MSKKGWVLYILSHHGPSNLHRTFEINLFGKKIHLCSRCTGIYIGIILMALISFRLPNMFKFILMISFTFPILHDWITQTLGKKESSNLVRMGTGLFYGISLWYLFSFLFSGLNIYSISSLFYLALVYLAIYGIHRRTGLMDNYVSTKFEGSKPPWKELD